MSVPSSADGGRRTRTWSIHAFEINWFRPYGLTQLYCYDFDTTDFDTTDLARWREASGK